MRVEVQQAHVLREDLRLSGAEIDEDYNLPMSAYENVSFVGAADVPGEQVRVMFILEGWAQIADFTDPVSCGSILSMPVGAAPWLRPFGVLRAVVFHLHPVYLAQQLRWLPDEHPLVHHLRCNLRDPLNVGRLEICPHMMRSLTPTLLRAVHFSRDPRDVFALLGSATEVFDVVGRASGSVGCTMASKRLPRKVTTIAVCLLRQYPQHDWTVAGLAGEVPISTSQLTRVFRADLGLSPAAYLRQVRVDRMAELLSTTVIAVGEAARRAGWANPTVAAKAFKRRYGMSPQKFSATLSTHGTA